MKAPKEKNFAQEGNRTPDLLMYFKIQVRRLSHLATRAKVCGMSLLCFHVFHAIYNFKKDVIYDTFIAHIAIITQSAFIGNNIPAWVGYVG